MRKKGAVGLGDRNLPVGSTGKAPVVGLGLGGTKSQNTMNSKTRRKIILKLKPVTRNRDRGEVNRPPAGEAENVKPRGFENSATGA